MKTIALAATAAIVALTAGDALAQSRSSRAAAGPSRPIPYRQLDAYTRASPSQRASRDWWAGSASTGMSTDTAATAPAGASTGGALSSDRGMGSNTSGGAAVPDTTAGSPMGGSAGSATVGAAGTNALGDDATGAARASAGTSTAGQAGAGTAGASTTAPATTSTGASATP